MVQGTVGARIEEWRQPEPPGEDQPEATTVPAGETRGGSPQGMSSTEAEQRSRLGRFIDLTALPGDRDSLRRNAEANDAPDDILAALDRLPPGTRFRTVSEVWAALGRSDETRR